MCVLVVYSCGNGVMFGYVRKLKLYIILYNCDVIKM